MFGFKYGVYENKFRWNGWWWTMECASWSLISKLVIVSTKRSTLAFVYNIRCTWLWLIIIPNKYCSKIELFFSWRKTRKYPKKFFPGTYGLNSYVIRFSDSNTIEWRQLNILYIDLLNIAENRTKLHFVNVYCLKMAIY